MRKVLILALGSVLMTLAPSQAAEQTRTYVGAFGRLIVTPPMCCDTAYGGYSFTVTGGDPVSLSITDQSGPGTAVLVCQEAGEAEALAASRCDDGGPGYLPGDDVVQKLCSTGAPQALDERFRAGGGVDHVSVFVFPIDVTAREPACPGTGTTGTLVLTH